MYKYEDIEVLGDGWYRFYDDGKWWLWYSDRIWEDEDEV